MAKNKNVDNNLARHKCSICGRVRFEKKMSIIKQKYYNGNVCGDMKTRFGNVCWYCSDNPDCEQKALIFHTY